ncbi:MAG TPA: serine/threonine-protein kinase [Bryobacteraceae bacterium]|nr:serine/threonine-protein kinase [Bryobacteraceae bacterium]
MQPSESLAPPAEKFGKYEIIRKLSRSLTDVYLARDTWTNQRVVLKRIEHSRDELTRIVIEAETRGAQIQRQLHHLDPRILEVYEFGEQNNSFFVAMEYFEGRTLAEILQTDRRFDPRRAARYAAEICSQLRTLHSFFSDVNGRKIAVVHGDIKPSNVQIGLKDDLKLLDFGIAKVITSTHHLTRHNLGSPSYCSPERLSKAQVDVHADLWAVGVSLFEMLSGSPPYQAQDTRQLENLIQSKRPPRALPEDCPNPLKAIGGKALAADIGCRYKSAEAFENDLRAFLEGRPTAAETEHAPKWDANATIEKQVFMPGLAIPAKAEPIETRLVATNVSAPNAVTKTVTVNPVNGRRSGAETRLSAASQAAKAKPAAARAPIHVRFVGNQTGNLAIALLAGLLAGLLLFMPLGYYYRLYSALSPLRSSRDYAHEPAQIVASDWSLYQDLKRRTAFLGVFSPVSASKGAFRANLLSAADNVIDSYRTSSDSHLNDFDWARARLCLQYALQIDAADNKAKGKLALCEGYLNLVQNPRLPKAALSIDNFRQAASYLPRAPDPHLGLARVYVYAFHNIGEAMAESQQAQRLGFQGGPRETAQQADGYLYRSEWELGRARQAAGKNLDEAGKWLQMSRADTENARKLYEPLVGFSNVSASLEQLYRDRSQQNDLEATIQQDSPAPPEPAKRKSVKRPAKRTHWWQLW